MTLQTTKCIFNNNPSYPKYKADSGFIRDDIAKFRAGFLSQFSKKYAESPSIKGFNSTFQFVLACS